MDKRLYTEGLDIGLYDAARLDLRHGLLKFGREELVRQLRDPEFLDYEMFSHARRPARMKRTLLLIRGIAKRLWAFEDKRSMKNYTEETYLVDKDRYDSFTRGYRDGFQAVCEVRFKKMMS
jgi:hypothetical protein